MSTVDFAYGYGRIGVLQQQLLSKPDVDRLIGAHSENEVAHILSDIPFTARVMPRATADVVVALEHWIKDQVVRMSPVDRRETFDIIWLREDVPAIAHLLKQHHGLTHVPDAADHRGVSAYDHVALRALVATGERGSLPEDLCHFIEELKHDRSIRVHEIDVRISRFVAEKQVQLAKESGSSLIVQYVAHLIDLQNIRTSRRLQEGDDGIDHFLSGGEIDPRRLTGDLSSIALLVQSSSLPNSLAHALSRERPSALLFERALSLALAHDIAAMRAMPLCIESVFAYAVMALSQTLMLRTILIGKAAHLTGAEISQMLPPMFSTAIENA